MSVDVRTFRRRRELTWQAIRVTGEAGGTFTEVLAELREVPTETYFEFKPDQPCIVFVNPIDPRVSWLRAGDWAVHGVFVESPAVRFGIWTVMSHETFTEVFEPVE